MGIAVEIATQPGYVAILGMKKIIPMAHAELDGHNIVTLADVSELLTSGGMINNATLRDVKAALSGVNVSTTDLKEQLQAVEYADAILSLPETADHPRAALQIINTHNAKTLPAPDAARFLRGLPSEHAEKAETTKGTSTMNLTTKDAANLKRRLEITSAGLSARSMNGNATADDLKQLKAVNYALQLTGTGSHIVKAVDMAGVDLDRLK